MHRIGQSFEYRITIGMLNVIIPTTCIDDCLYAINLMHSPDGDYHQKQETNPTRLLAGVGERKGHDMAPPASTPKEVERMGFSYRYVQSPPPEGYQNIYQAFNYWRYTAIDCQGGILVKEFNARLWGDDELLYETIAPFVYSGGWVKVYAEDNAMWGYEFHKGILLHRNAKVIWE